MSGTRQGASHTGAFYLRCSRPHSNRNVEGPSFAAPRPCLLTPGSLQRLARVKGDGETGPPAMGTIVFKTRAALTKNSVVSIVSWTASARQFCRTAAEQRGVLHDHSNRLREHLRSAADRYGPRKQGGSYAAAPTACAAPDAAPPPPATKP